jgi:hypothetical protein
VHYYKPDVDDWELLDRQADPLEVRDFSREPEYAAVVQELKAEIERLRKEVDEVGDPPRAAYGNQRFDNEPAPPMPQPRQNRQQPRPAN